MQLSRMTRGMNCHSPFVYPKLFAGEGKRKRIIFMFFIDLDVICEEKNSFADGIGKKENGEIPISTQ